MFQRRPHRTAPRTRSLALGGALAALAVVGGGTVVAVSAPAEVTAGDILLAQNATAQEMKLGAPVNLDLEPVVARAAGGTIPGGTTVQVTGLPDGLTQDGWVISGTPTRAGDYDVLVTVSNGPVSQSEKLTVSVVDAAGAGTGAEAGARVAAPNAATTTAAAPAADGEPGPDAAVPTTSESVPTLSAVPGDPEAGGAEDDGSAADGTGDDDEAGVAPDLCSILGDGQVADGTTPEADGASLARLLPAIMGEDDSASSGLVLVLVNAIVSMLPAVLGDSGSTNDLGSAGQLLCTLSPSLLGGATSGEATDGTAVGTTAGATDGAAGAAALGATPAALLGLLTTGAGSLGN